MKVYITALLLFSIAFTADAQAKRAPIFKALSNQKLDVLEKRMHETVDLCILEYQDLLSKEEALRRIRRFLNEIDVRSAGEIHKGSALRKKSSYRVGKLEGRSDSYRVFVYFEEGKIREIRFDSY